MYYHNYTNYQSNWNKSQKGHGYASTKGNSGSGMKRKVKNFSDLEVYQKAQAGCVFCSKEMISAIKPIKKEKGSSKARQEFQTLVQDALVKKIIQDSLAIPALIAKSHSKRFGSSTECLEILDDVMLKCNLLVVYMEQARDLLDTSVEADRWQEQIKNYFYIRQKVLNLQRVWRKYIQEKEQQN